MNSPESKDPRNRVAADGQADRKMSICLVRLSALGDVVMVLPLVRALQLQRPAARLTWIIGRGAYPLVAALADEGIEFVVVDKPCTPLGYLRFWRMLAGRKFDVALCLQANWRVHWMYLLISARRKIGFSADRAKDFHRWFVSESVASPRSHNVDAFGKFGEALGLAQPPVATWRLPVSAEAAVWADRHLPAGPLLVVAPCASKSERDWLPERYAAVMRAAGEKHGAVLVLVGGRSRRELALAGAIRAAIPQPVCDLTGQTTLPQFVAVLARARVLLAPDTAAVHLANALGRPVVGLYAVARSRRTGPYGQLQFCVDRYEEAVRKILGRDPAHGADDLRVHDRRAMHLIEVADVLQQLDRAWAEGVAMT